MQKFGIPGRPAPQHCRCGMLSPKPSYGPVLGLRGEVWSMYCACGIIHIWSHPGTWKEHIPDPINYTARRFALLS